MEKNVALYTAGIIFTIVAIIHLWRLYAGFEIMIGVTVVPVWGSVVGLIVAGILAIWMFMAARN